MSFVEAMYTYAGNRISFPKRSFMTFPKRFFSKNEAKKSSKRGGLGKRDEDERERERKRWFLEMRVSRRLTLLALGIIRPAKEIGIARNSWERVEFHMKYTWHLLPSPAGPLQRRKRIINRSPPCLLPLPPSLSLHPFFFSASLEFSLRLSGREARRLRKVPRGKREHGTAAAAA